MSLLFYLPVCLSVAYSGNAAKAKRIKRGSAVAPAKQHNRSPHGGASIEVNTMLPSVAAEGEKRQSTHTIAATPMSALLTASETASDREPPSGRRQACLVTSPNIAEESPAGETTEMLPHTSIAVAAEREGEHDEENPPLSAAVLSKEEEEEEYRENIKIIR